MSSKKNTKNITLKESIKSKNEKNNIITENCSTQNMIYYISLIISIILELIIIKGLDEIYNNTACKCDKIKNKGKYLKEWFIFMIIYKLSIFFMFLISGEECFDTINKYNIIIIFGTIVSIINIIMLVRLFIYINSIRKDCSCSYGTTQKFIYWYLLILFSIFVISITTMIILIIMILILKGGSRKIMKTT
jgi:hypothetical protein